MKLTHDEVLVIEYENNQNDSYYTTIHSRSGLAPIQY